MNIQCVFIAYFDFEIIKKSLESIIKTNSFDITVIENYSEYTETSIKPYLLDLIDKGAIKQYFLFEKNISNNAFEIIMRSGHIDLSQKYILLTDGDLLPTDNWLQDQLSIMDDNSDVFTCSVAITLSNLPIHTFPEAKHWVGSPTQEFPNYNVGYTGFHLLMFRCEQVRDFLEYIKEKNLKWVDSSLHRYCNELKMKWARTKRSSSTHLTWDCYSDLNHPYTKEKLSKSFKEHWNHDGACGFKRYVKSSI